MTPAERQPRFLIENGYFERCEDFEFAGRKVLASRLGYRMTAGFLRTFFGRVFNHPHVVFTDEMLRPEKQDLAVFADGMDNIVTTQQRVAESYFLDGTVELACPPLRALLHIMAHGHHEGRDASDPAFRALFTRESLLASDWYAARLEARQRLDTRLWHSHATYLQRFLQNEHYAEEAERLRIKEKLESVWDAYHEAKSPNYLAKLQGTIGVQPMTHKGLQG